MSREFPDFIDPWRLAAGGKEIGGTIPLKRFKRLEPLLTSTDGEAEFRIRFEFDQHRRAKARVTVSASLMLMCQTSLSEYVEDVSQQSELLIIGEAGEQGNLADQEEFILVDDGRLAIAEVVEDELLLAVPQVPRKPGVEAISESTTVKNESVTGSSQETEGRQRPFEALAELMKDR